MLHANPPRFDGERHTAFRTNLQAQTYRFADVFEALFARRALRHAPRNGWALDDPNAVFIPLDRNVELHGHRSILDGASLYLSQCHCERSEAISDTCSGIAPATNA